MNVEFSMYSRLIRLQSTSASPTPDSRPSERIFDRPLLSYTLRADLQAIAEALGITVRPSVPPIASTSCPSSATPLNRIPAITNLNYTLEIQRHILQNPHLTEDRRFKGLYKERQARQQRRSSQAVSDGTQAQNHTQTQASESSSSAVSSPYVTSSAITATPSTLHIIPAMPGAPLSFPS